MIMKLTPLYTVGFREIRRGHWYTATGQDGIEHGPFPSVTKIKGIIDKSEPLIIWARKAALELAGKHLMEHIRHGEPLTEETLAELLKKADKQPDKIKDDAADLGSRIHAAIDAHITGAPIILDPESKIGYDNFLKWLDQQKIKLIQGDSAVVSLKHKFGGRVDAFGEQDGKLVLLDWKSSKAIYDTFAVQIGGYAIATEETYGLAPLAAQIVRFGKIEANDFEARPVNLENAKAAFLAANILYNSLKEKLWI